WLNPSWTPGRKEELKEFYGGMDTAGWQHEVAGEHGWPSYGAFNIEYLTLCRQDIPESQRIVITGEELKDCESEEAVESRLDMLLNLAHLSGTFWVGVDTGYTNDPTEIVVFKETQEPNERLHLKLVLRVHLEHVAYPHISACLALIDRYYNPAGIGLDNGGNGLSIVQELISLDKYRSLGLKDRLRGFDFGSSIPVYLEENGAEKKKPAKEYMTSLITGSLQRRELVLPIDDVDIESQFSTHTYVMTNGRVQYSKGNDHIIDAVRCALLIREQFRDDNVWGQTITEIPIPVLTDPIFI
ncbi:MAG: hypothetical protein HZA78_10075, partial [Candidatus Schekmanbacteria bacterium]|nr:hypothetical protein [Candidatus Schekmanbacteria bacterium]